jgi:hypothetical protein
MRVICVNDKVVNPFCNYPKFGEVVNVSQCDVRDDHYDVQEYPLDINGNPQSIAKYRFIPLSDIDETELIKERELEKV